MKKSSLVLLTMFSAVSLAIVGIISVDISPISPFLNVANAGDTTYTITLDSSRKPTITAGTGSFTYNTDASFTYTNASDNPSGHVSLADGGTIYKNQASKSLETFTATFSGPGSLILQTGYSGNEDRAYVYSLTSEMPASVRGNYFKLISTGATNINEIVIEFGCEEEEIEGVHNPIAVAQVDPTETETGFTAGTVCSECGRILSGREVLPVLDQEGINYYYRNRTAKVDDIVADFDEYIWKEDENVVIYANPTNPLEHYIHAGSSYYSIETWNGMFKNQNSVVTVDGDDKTLTMTLDGDTTVVAEDLVSDLDGTFDLLLYKNVVIDGNGTLNITYTEDQDGIKCHNLAIGENVTLNLTGNDATKKTGVSFAGTLQIDGIYSVNKFGNGIGINTDINASAIDNILVNGALNINNCKDGIHAWNTPSGGASINVNGALNMTNISEQGMELVSAVTINFNSGCDVDITADKNAILRNSSGTINFKGGAVDLTVTGSSSSSTAIGSLNNVALQTNNAAAINFDGGVVNITSGDIGIKVSAIMTFNFNNTVDVNINAGKVGLYATYESDNNNLTLNDSASLTVTSTYGSGIIINNQGRVNLRNSSTLEITAAASGLYGFSKLYVCQGALADHTKNSASLKVHISGNGSCDSSVNKEGNAIQGRDGASYFTFDTTGEVLIENTGNSQGKYGIHIGGGNSGNAYFQVYASNMTIKNFTSAIYCNGNRTWTVNYDFTSTGCAKVNIINCGDIYDGNTSPISTKFTNDTCNVSAN